MRKINTGISDLFFNHEPMIEAYAAWELEDEGSPAFWISPDVLNATMEFMEMLAKAGVEIDFTTDDLIADFYARAR